MGPKMGPKSTFGINKQTADCILSSSLPFQTNYCNVLIDTIGTVIRQT